MTASTDISPAKNYYKLLITPAVFLAMTKQGVGGWKVDDTSIPEDARVVDAYCDKNNMGEFFVVVFCTDQYLGEAFSIVDPPRFTAIEIKEEDNE